MNTIIEKIRAEVNRLKKQLVRGACAAQIQMETSCKDEAYDEMLDILSDLEKEEKPMELDFEQALYKHFGQVKDFTLGLQIAKHFYELGCRRTAEKYDEIEYKRQRADVCEGLEEAGEEQIIERAKDLYPKLLPFATYICGYAFHDNDGTPKETIQKYLAIGAEWQKEQMMKEAVEGRVVDAGIFATYNTPVEYTHSGDKVKIIIVKED